jgi:hypothetical protein
MYMYVTFLTLKGIKVKKEFQKWISDILKQKYIQELPRECDVVSTHGR